MSPKRLKSVREKKARKLASFKREGMSVYARKKRGEYPPNSPYRTIWAEYA